MSTAPAAPPPAHTPPPAGPVDWSAAQRLALGAAVGGLALFGIAAAVNFTPDHGLTDALSAYLSGWTFWFSLPAGAMALLMIHYLVKTSWGILLRRSLESATRTLPLMAVLFVPFAALALTQHTDHPLYWWMAPDAAHPHDAAAPKADDKKDADPGEAKRQLARENAAKLRSKAVEHEREARAKGNYSFLSPPAFVGCSVFYFAVWGVLIYLLNKWGQDAEDSHAKVEPSLEKLKNMSGPGLIVFALTITAASTQWVMSLQDGWASTMFPVIFAVNQFLTTFAFCVAVFLLLVNRPPFRGVVRDKFRLDMGSLLLAFTLFWSYTSFSQLMLIWIGNLPEEIPFFLKRSNPVFAGWWWVSAGLIVFHFALPFVLLLFRDIKLHPVRLRLMAVYLLVVCAVDVVYWIEPTHEHHSALFVLMDVGAVLGVGGVWGVAFLYFLKRRPLLPANELYQLPEGHDEHH